MLQRPTERQRKIFRLLFKKPKRVRLPPVTEPADLAERISHASGRAKGGYMLAASMTKEERTERARNAAEARWKRPK